METMIDNLINGNCSTARKQAKRFSLPRIVAYLQEELGWNLDRAYKCAVFLKTGNGFQQYCDAS